MSLPMPLALNPVSPAPTLTSTAPTTSAVSGFYDRIFKIMKEISLYLCPAESGALMTGPLSLLGLLVVAVAAHS